MVNAAVEVMAFLLGFAGWVMSGIVIPYHFWKISTIEGNVITASLVYENLWMSCATDSTGVHNCRELPSMLGVAGFVQACRALMITSIVLGMFGLIFTLVGMQCSKIGYQKYDTKH
ncbi:claudin-15 [Silurus meridionalis]|nr:claudin-15 [Silurus meridionalis]